MKKILVSCILVALFLCGTITLAQSSVGEWSRFPFSDTSTVVPYCSMMLGARSLQGEVNASTPAAYCNQVVGSGSMMAAITTGAIQNNVVGPGDLTALTTGSGNFVWGYNSATTLLDGSNNAIAGNAINTTSTNSSNQVNLFGAFFGHTNAIATVTSGSGNCGTSPIIAANDNGGTVIVGSSTNGGVCTINFAQAWSATPGCLCADNTTASHGCTALSISTTSAALTATTTFAAGDKLSYHCDGAGAP